MLSFLFSNTSLLSVATVGYIFWAKLGKHTFGEAVGLAGIGALLIVMWLVWLRTPEAKRDL